MYVKINSVKEINFTLTFWPIFALERLLTVLIRECCKHRKLSLFLLPRRLSAQVPADCRWTLSVEKRYDHWCLAHGKGRHLMLPNCLSKQRRESDIEGGIRKSKDHSRSERFKGVGLLGTDLERDVPWSTWTGHDLFTHWLVQQTHQLPAVLLYTGSTASPGLRSF